MAKAWSEIRKKSKLTEAQRNEDDQWVQRELLDMSLNACSRKSVTSRFPRSS